MKNMRQICRVLLWIGEQDKPVCVKDVAQGVGITEGQAKASLYQLHIKGKVNVTQDGLNGLNWYEDNPEYTEAPRPKLVRTKSNVAKAREMKLPVAMQDAFRFADKKISLLRRLQARCVDTDADLIEGIIHDYQAVSVRKTA